MDSGAASGRGSGSVALVQEIPAVLRTAPFTIRHAAKFGISARVVRGKRFRQIIGGVYGHVDLCVTPTVLAAAALLIAPPNSRVTGIAGLHVHGATVGDPLPVQVLSTHPHQVRRRDLTVIRVRMLPEGGRYICSPLPCFAVACRFMCLLEAVQAADVLIRLQKTSPAALVDFARTLTGRGAVLARRAAGLARSEVDSVRETMLRLCLVLAGLPEPTVNPRIGTAHDAIGRMDLVYFEYMLIVEYDGDHHRTDPRQWAIDIARQEAAAAAGWLTVRVTNQRMRRARNLVREVYQHLVERGYRGPVPSFSAEWRSIFE